MQILLNQFDKNWTIEELIWEIEYVQMFLMATPSEDHKLPEITLIDYRTMKLKGMDMYNTVLDQWQPVTNRQMAHI